MLVGRRMAVDREFACILFIVYSVVIRWSPLVGSGTSFRPPWGDFAPPFGSLWGALGSQGALLDFTLASLWLLWDALGPFGAPWAPKGSF